MAKKQKSATKAGQRNRLFKMTNYEAAYTLNAFLDCYSKLAPQQQENFHDLFFFHLKSQVAHMHGKRAASSMNHIINRYNEEDYSQRLRMILTAGFAAVHNKACDADTKKLFKENADALFFRVDYVQQFKDNKHSPRFVTKAGFSKAKQQELEKIDVLTMDCLMEHNDFQSAFGNNRLPDMNPHLLDYSRRLMLKLNAA